MNATQSNIKSLRQSGLSQVEIAKEIKTSQALVSRWEAGLIPPAVKTAERIADLVKKASNPKAKK